MYFPRIFVAASLIISIFLSTDTRAEVKTTLTWSKEEKDDIRKLSAAVVKDNTATQITNANWLVRTDFGPVFTAEASYFMEMFSDQIIDIILDKPAFKVAEKPVLTIFDTKDEYFNVPGITENSRGICMYGYRTRGQEVIDWKINLYTYFEHKSGKDPQFGECYLPVILHEGTHAIVARIFGTARLPLWFNEGLACYYESMQIKGVNKLSGAKTAIMDVRARQERTIRSWRPEELKKYLAANPGANISIDYLSGLVSNEAWNPDNMGPKTVFNYAISESFIDFLMDSQSGRMVLRKIAELSSAGNSDAVPAVIKPLESKWKQYLEKSWKVRGK